ncbi:2TM domain-containing protein [uncultured Tateyamaria sp.]|uniref:2TM domain-containing protein n=1 Tax=uncultured Tateyamaria sp. TaxID=455651 RepID=UPI00260B33F1|nr:2TM domain-containing protein [uncultured Tateyamaria sp.]
MEQSQAYQAAKDRIEARIGFYTHLAVYIAVILFLAVINFVTSSGTIWVHWPALGWGVAVALHGIFAVVLPGRFAVTDAMIAKEMGKPHSRF